MRGSGMGVTIGLLMALAVWAPAAQAVAPDNDNFADREVLSGLPIEVTRSNVEATKEAGENLGSFQAGHSIWFEWQAPSSEWFTIGACDENFRHVVGVFTGTAVNALTRIANGNRDEGPDCPFTEKQFSFKATAGVDYKIAIDGNPFYVPPSPMPPTEGSTTLRIGKTPDPPNDDFAAAETDRRLDRRRRTGAGRLLLRQRARLQLDRGQGGGGARSTLVTPVAPPSGTRGRRRSRVWRGSASAAASKLCLPCTPGTRLAL